MQMTAHLSESTFNLAEEVIIRHLWSFVIDVVDCKAQLLHFLKVIIQFKSTSELWTQAILHILRPSKLCKSHLAMVKHNYRSLLIDIVLSTLLIIMHISHTCNNHHIDTTYATALVY